MVTPNHSNSNPQPESPKVTDPGSAPSSIDIGGDQFADLVESAIDFALSSRDPKQTTAWFVGMLRPLLSMADADLKMHKHRCTHIPSQLRPVINSPKQSRIMAIGRVMLTNPDHDWFMQIYGKWCDSNPSQVQRLRDAVGGNAVQLWEPLLFPGASADGSSRRDFVCTLWALTRGMGRPRRLLDLASQLTTLTEQLAGKNRAGPQGRSGQRQRASRGRFSRLSEEIKDLQTQLQEAMEKASKNVDEVQRLTRLVDEKQREIKDAKRRNIRLEQSLETQRSQKESVTAKLQSQREHNQSLEDDLKTLTLARHDSSSALTRAEAEIQLLRAKIAEKPAGPAEFWTFVEGTLKRVRQERDTGQGGAKVGATNQYPKIATLKAALEDAFPELRAYRSPPKVAPAPPKGRLKFQALGGIDVGGSCYLLEIGSHRILIDCGVRANAETVEEMGIAVDSIPEVEVVVVTHAHADHAGWLPALIHSGRSARFLCTKETDALLRVMLKDGRKQLERLMAWQQVRANNGVCAVPVEPYDQSDVETALKRIRPHGYREPYSVGDLKISLWPAGHILGAASVLVESAGRRVFLTGDYCIFQQETLFANEWPTDRAPVDLLVTESTYGADAAHSRDEQVDGLIREVKDVLRSRGTVIIPSFAVGRAQEVLAILQRAFRSNQLEQCRVWIDGLIQDINAVYKASGKLRLEDSLFVEVRKQGYERSEVLKYANSEPSIIVTTAGTMSGGPVIYYAKHLLPDGRNRILFCGHQDDEAPGYKLLQLSQKHEGKSKVTVFDEETRREISIHAKSSAKVFHLSAHSTRSEMMSAIRQMSPQHVVLVHGSEPNRTAFANELSRAGMRVAGDGKLELPGE